MNAQITINELGIQTLPFVKYGETITGVWDKEVNVVFYVNYPETRMTVIVVEDNGEYQDFYYNDGMDCFKPLSETEDDSGMTPEEWWSEESIEADCPDFLTSVSSRVCEKLTRG